MDEKSYSFPLLSQNSVQIARSGTDALRSKPDALAVLLVTDFRDFLAVPLRDRDWETESE
jgi:hypothetical protein